jgi:hypothetical protein
MYARVVLTRHMRFHNAELARLVPEGEYRPDDLARIRAALESHQTLTFVRLPSGLFPASSAGAAIAASGYGNVWIRDNVFVAFVHYETGATTIAVDVMRALMTFVNRHCHRFETIISGAV